MRRALLPLLVIAILGIFMMPGKAMAHEGYSYDVQSDAPVQSAHEKSGAPVLKAEVTIVRTASAVSSSREDTCKGGCCSSMGACCFVAAPPSSLSINIIGNASYAGLPELSLPQGPPSSLLRPPRFSA